MFIDITRDNFSYAKEIRHKIHENPELSGEERETIALVTDELEKAGIDYKIVNKGGILAFIKGNKESNNPKTILLRADLDALAITESKTNLAGEREVISKNEGVMHACGHDSHTAMAITIGKILNESRDLFSGDVILCFERGEEVGLNYRYLMAYIDKADIKIDACYGLHVSPDYESGVIAIKEGPINAGAMAFDVTIKGAPGHGSRPHLAINPLDCFTDIYAGLKNIPMSKLSPFEPFTYSIGAVEMGSLFNQIPDKLRFKGTARFFDRSVGYTFHNEFKNMIISKARANNCRVVFNTFSRPHFPIINDDVLASFCKDVMADEIGASNICDAKPSMGSDSFSIYTSQWPGLYLMLGISNSEKGSGASLHSDKFDLDDEAMINGIAASLRFIVEYLNSDIKLTDAPFKNDLEALFREESLKREEIEEIYESIKC